MTTGLCYKDVEYEASTSRQPKSQGLCQLFRLFAPFNSMQSHPL
jgi:hypothetical protein